MTIRSAAQSTGGCVLKWDGQLNALILPETPEGDFSWVSYDGFPALTALDQGLQLLQPVLPGDASVDKQVMVAEENVGQRAALRYVMALSQTHRVHTLLGNCDNLVLDFVDGRGTLNEDFFSKKWFSLGEKSVLVKMAHLAGVPIESPADYPAARAAISARFKPQ